LGSSRKVAIMQGARMMTERAVHRIHVGQAPAGPVSFWPSLYSFLACTRTFALPCLGLFLALLPLAAQAADQTPRAFLQSIYKHYIGTNTAGVKLDKDADYRRYFTPELAQMILDDIAKSQKNDDVPALDGDPFIDAQDWSITKIDIDVDDKATDKTVGKVSFKNLGEAKTITLDLVKIDGAWKIDDIHWPEATLRSLYKQ